MVFKKIKRLTKKAFSSKTYMLMGVNRVIPDSLGKMTDIMVDKDEKNVFLELEQHGQQAKLDIIGYGLVYEGNSAFITFKSIKKSGYLNTTLKSLDYEKKIYVEPKYIKLVERMI